MLREALGIAATSVALAPTMLAAQLADRVLTFDATSALRTLGIVERPLRVERMMGGRSSAVYRVTLASDANRRDAKAPSSGSILDRARALAAWRLGGSDLVLKHALASGSVLALGARIAGPQPYPSDLSSAGRVAREARELAAAGVGVPRLVAADAERGLLLVATWLRAPAKAASC